MFTLRTAERGEAYHHFFPIQRLGDAVPSEGFDNEVVVNVRIDQGAPESVEVRVFYVDSYNGASWEVPTYRGGSSIEMIRYVNKLERRVRALLELGLFQLEPNL